MALKITLKKSLISCKKNQPENAATLGKVRVISHLVEVEKVKEARKK